MGAGEVAGPDAGAANNSSGRVRAGPGRSRNTAMAALTIHEAKDRLSELIQRLTPGKEIITEDDWPVARSMPAAPPSESRKAPRLGTPRGRSCPWSVSTTRSATSRNTRGKAAPRFAHTDLGGRPGQSAPGPCFCRLVRPGDDPHPARQRLSTRRRANRFSSRPRTYDDGLGASVMLARGEEGNCPRLAWRLGG